MQNIYDLCKCGVPGDWFTEASNIINITCTTTDNIALRHNWNCTKLKWNYTCKHHGSVGSQIHSRYSTWSGKEILLATVLYVSPSLRMISKQATRGSAIVWGVDCGAWGGCLVLTPKSYKEQREASRQGEDRWREKTGKGSELSLRTASEFITI